MFKVYTANEVFEVSTLDEAQQAVASEWNESGQPDKSGFINPWIEDEDGNEIQYTPTQDEIDMWKE